MAAKYKVILSESGSSVLLTAEQLHKKYGGESEQDEFVAALISTPILRSTLKIESIEKLSPETLFAEAKQKVEDIQTDLAKAKAELDSALLEVLAEITDDEVDKGEYIKLSKADNAVEYSTIHTWLLKAKPNLDKLLTDHGDELPTHVVFDLRRIQGKRKKNKDA